MRTNIPNKTNTPKYSRLNGKQRFMLKEGLKQSDPIQDGGRHPINQKISGVNNIDPEMLGHMHLKQQSLSGFKKVFIFSFSNSILGRSINTGCLMKDVILKHE